MQYVKNDMDDLFKRAAENYPLNTNSANWNSIVTALQNDNPQTENNKSNTYNRYLILLFFLGLPFLCNRFIKLNFNYALNEGASEFVINKPDRNLIKNEKISEKKYYKTYSNNESIGVATPLIPFNLNNNGTVTPIKTKKRSGADNLYTIKKNQEALNFSLAEKIKIERMLMLKADSLNLDQFENKWVSKPATTTKKWYAGFLAGTDVTTIKFQKTADAGYLYGILLGYQINKKWSIEAAVISSKKYYYTNGDNYNAYKLNLPYNTKITSVDGNCRMIELPVTIKYNFGNTEKNHWFTTAGLSSFIMKKEEYDFMYLYMSSGNTSKHSKTYKNASENWLSVLQLSGGYQFNVHNIADVRIEPFVQIPLNGVGIGNLPMSSGGIKLGLTKKMF